MRTVKITYDQRQQLTAVMAKKDLCADLLAKTIDELTERIAKDENEMWDQIFEIAKADRETERCKVRLISGDILVIPRDEVEE